MNEEEIASLKKFLSRRTKAELVDTVLARQRSLHSMRDQCDDYSSRGFQTEQALTAAKTSLAELEKVQQELVARLERAYEALVKAVLK